MEEVKKEKSEKKGAAKTKPDKQPGEKGGKKQQKKSQAAPDARVEREKYVEEKVPVRLLETYRKEIIPALAKKFNYKNPFQAPALKKISLNVGAGAATQDPKLITAIAKDVELITGQKPVITKAKKSVSNFKLRQGMEIGCKVTLRKARMYEFLDRLVNVAIPRVRDFRGLPDKSFDGNGNYTLGVKEQMIFPEINADTVGKVFGMDITFVTSAGTNEEAFELLKAFGMPFVKKTPAAEQ